MRERVSVWSVTTTLEPFAALLRRGRAMTRADDASSGLMALATTVARLNLALKAVAERLHSQDGLSAGDRSILLDLVDPRTVPGLARLRPVSRQVMQRAVDSLIERGLVITQANPEHRRSVLVALSKKGASVTHQIRERERTFSRKCFRDVDAKAIAKAHAVLLELHQALRTCIDVGEAS